MKDNTQPTRTLTKNGPRLISERKLEANRENAKKSSGPRTARGKAFSRRNAVKHGLCASDLFPLMRLPTESEQEFLDFHHLLREEYQPVGFEEEWLVKRIAICRWRLDRAWRHENAEISSAVIDAYFKEFENDRKVLDTKLQAQRRYESQISAEFEKLLNDADKEIDAGNGIPADFKVRLATVDFPNRSICEFYAKHQIARHPELLASSARDADLVVAYLTAKAVNTFRHLPEPMPLYQKLKVACEQQAIPSREAVDRMVRYESLAERGLRKALDRLETLQRRRRGERG